MSTSPADTSSGSTSASRHWRWSCSVRLSPRAATFGTTVRMILAPLASLKLTVALLAMAIFGFGVFWGFLLVLVVDDIAQRGAGKAREWTLTQRRHFQRVSPRPPSARSGRAVPRAGRRRTPWTPDRPPGGPPPVPARRSPPAPARCAPAAPSAASAGSPSIGSCAGSASSAGQDACAGWFRIASPVEPSVADTAPPGHGIASPPPGIWMRPSMASASTAALAYSS